MLKNNLTMFSYKKFPRIGFSNDSGWWIRTSLFQIKPSVEPRSQTQFRLGFRINIFLEFLSELIAPTKCRWALEK